jgi:hypothetical protein
LIPANSFVFPNQTKSHLAPESAGHYPDLYSTIIYLNPGRKVVTCAPALSSFLFKIAEKGKIGVFGLCKCGKGKFGEQAKGFAFFVLSEGSFLRCW